MKISGLQKLTLLDFPGKTAATVFTSGCNFRCPFCHNAGLVTKLDEAQEIAKDEVLSYLKKRAGVLDGVCVTGGEPLLQADIADFLSEIKSMGYKVKLDTNGSFPEKLRELVAAGLCDYVAMDVKNSREKYGETVGFPDFDISAVSESVDFLLSGACDYEFRTTVVRELHTPQDIVKIAEWIKDTRHYYIQTYVDSGDILCGGYSAYSEPEMLEILENTRLVLPCAVLRGA